MTLKEWMEDIQDMPFGELDDIHKALATLLSWKCFNREFNDLGIRALQTMIRVERENRLKDAVEGGE